MSQDVYLHGTETAEQARLSAMNALLNDAALEVIGVRTGMRVLEVGAGLGHFARAMAGAGASVVGIERDPAQLREAERLGAGASGVEMREGDATSPPLGEEEWGSFDLAHARFILEHVRDPASVVRMMARAVKPGGRVVLQDDDHDLLRLWPDVPEWTRLWPAYCALFERSGLDPWIGRKLPAHLAAAELRPTRMELLKFGACNGDPHWDGIVENFKGVLRGARGHLSAAGLATGEQVDETVGALERWRNEEGAALWYVVCYAEGVKD